ncbi:MAG: HD-GYP domain-containing protein [Gemmatimonadaceae bacterium]
MVGYASLLISAAAGALLVGERRKRRRFERLGAASLEALLDAIEANNPETGAHVRRVASFSLIIAEAADLDDHECHVIERVALFHDIGKLDGAISDIVQVPTKLTPEDWESVRTHPQRGADVLRPLSAFFPGLPLGVIAHHERWDGKGYPRGLKGLQIPLSARVVAIADTFDAITHSRSYSRAQSFDAATMQIAKGRGEQFDPALVDVFMLPPVLERIAKAMKDPVSPRRVNKQRRKSRETQPAPDINFRWRKQAEQPPL